MKLNKNSFLIQCITGAIGKEFVIKHYGDKVVIAKYPDMTKIKPNARQVKQRNLFKEAVQYAKEVYWDQARRLAWQAKLPKSKSVFNHAIKHYMKMARDKKHRDLMAADYLIEQSFNNMPLDEMKYLLVLNDAL